VAKKYDLEHFARRYMMAADKNSFARFQPERGRIIGSLILLPDRR
jgi:hypothetical protein